LCHLTYLWRDGRSLFHVSGIPLQEKETLRAFLLTIPVIYFSLGQSQFYNHQSPYFILLAWTWFMMMRQTPFAFHSAQAQTLS